jgi:acetyl/propionyl-CoA carboxylase alpha subunit
VDSGVDAGSEVVGLYDPLIAKVIAHGVDREHARTRMLRALDE